MLILHGENTVLSRRKLINLIQSFPGEIIRLEGEKIGLADIKQALEAQSLFGQKRLVVIENFFSRRPSKEKEALLKYLKEEKAKNLIIWEGKTIDGRSLISFKFAQIERFIIPAIIFKFLDALTPQRKSQGLYFFHQCLCQERVEIIFYMLVGRITNLILAADLEVKGLEKMANWQKSRLVYQAKQFGLKKLLWLYKQLLEIDYQQKTGQASMPLSSQLDLFIASF